MNERGRNVNARRWNCIGEEIQERGCRSGGRTGAKYIWRRWSRRGTGTWGIKSCHSSWSRKSGRKKICGNRQVKSMSNIRRSRRSSSSATSGRSKNRNKRSARSRRIHIRMETEPLARWYIGAAAPGARPGGTRPTTGRKPNESSPTWQRSVGNRSWLDFSVGIRFDLVLCGGRKWLGLESRSKCTWRWRLRACKIDYF